MTTTVETFTYNGQHSSTLVETIGGDGIITQEWQHAPDFAPFAGGQPGVRTVNVRLADADDPDFIVNNADIDKLVAAWKAACARPGMRAAGRRDDKAIVTFLEQTRGAGVLHATSAI